MRDTLFLASPVLYRAGDPPRVPLPDSTGLLIPGIFFAGRGTSLKGVTVLAPGYAPTWFWDLWRIEKNAVVRLVPAEEGGSGASDRVLALLNQSQIRGSALDDRERAAFAVIPAFDIEVRFTKTERQNILEFLTSSAGRQDGARQR